MTDQGRENLRSVIISSGLNITAPLSARYWITSYILQDGILLVKPGMYYF